MKHFFVVLLLLGAMSRARAGEVRHASLAQMASAADAVAAVQVVSVEALSSAEIEARTKTIVDFRGRTVVRRDADRKRAFVRVLRSFPADAFPDSTVEIEYSSRQAYVFHGKDGSFGTFDVAFAAVPILQKDDCVVLPLRKPIAPATAWTLNPTEGTGLIVPALASALADSVPQSRMAFLQQELVNGLVNGNTQKQPFAPAPWPSWNSWREQKDELERAVSYLYAAEGDESSSDRKKPFDTVYEDAVRRIANDDARLATLVATSLKISGGTTHFTMASLSGTKKRWRPYEFWPLPSDALSAMKAQSSTRSVEDRVVEALIAIDAALPLAQNFPSSAQTVRYFRVGLAEGNQTALERIMTVQNSNAKLDASVLSDARRGAKLVIQNPASDTELLYVAASVLQQNGDDAAFRFLDDEIKRLQWTNAPRYKSLWSGVTWETTTGKAERRVFPIVKRALFDSRVYGGDIRYSDWAVDVLSSWSGQSFGISPAKPRFQMTRVDRDIAVAAAKKWLRLHGGVLPPTLARSQPSAH